MELLSYPQYIRELDATRDSRMAWWREARFGMFVHFGLYSVLQRHEWAMAAEGIPVEEYEKLTEGFQPKPGAPREWAKLAKAAGMKYMVLTTRHHEGFSLWDSKANPYNSVNYGPKRDIVREFVEACREYGLKIGFYTSLMDWHHPDGGRAAFDSAARKRFNDYIYALNEELLTNYGKIDILWYDVAAPMEHYEGWNSLEMNQRLRVIQPHIIINDRSRLPEDFGTPEEHITATDRDWEACMTFNGISWGYLDSAQILPYSYNAQQIIRMLQKVTGGGGNLLLNIGPAADGSIPPEAVEPLTTVGKWLEENGEAVYGKVDPCDYWASGIASPSRKGRDVYFWSWVWPEGGTLPLGGFLNQPVSASLLADGTPLELSRKDGRVIVKGLPPSSPDRHANVGVIKLTFAEEPEHSSLCAVPALNKGDTSIFKG